MTTRREVITKCGLGIAGIIAAGKAPATVVKSLLGVRGIATGDEEEVETYVGSAFRVTIPQSAIDNGGGSISVGFQTFTRLSGYSSVSIDWGDGSEPIEATSTSNAVHIYTNAGSFVINIAEGCSQFRPNATLRPYVVNAICWGETVLSADSTYNGCSNLTGNIPKWGNAIVNATQTYFNCRQLIGCIPEWNSKITNAIGTYQQCYSLTGAIPAWGVSITNAWATYNNCRGLTGTVPEWTSKITNAYSTYAECKGLTGTIPKWKSSITTARETYRGCSGLVGRIPKWGSSITNAYSTYIGCRNLTGVWEEDGEIPPPSSLMPSKITSYSNCVTDTTDSLRSYFYTTWGGTITPPE